MPKITMIGRVYDGLPLAASMADEKDAYAGELETYERQAKKIIRMMSKNGADNSGGYPYDASAPTSADMHANPTGSSSAKQTFITIETNDFFCFHYVIDNGVYFLTLTEKAYPKRLAYDYLDELRKEFLSIYGAQVMAATRPYEFIKFDQFIQKTKKLYTDARTQRNLDKLNSELKDVHYIMTKNINEVLQRGEILENVTKKSNRLSYESKKYMKSTVHANRVRLLKTYGPIVVIGFVALFLFWFVYLRRR
eukprot:CAMPEP_0184697892 /NCGR_PEP_ID=MMETSP0313-20130426/4686_1 /TAXON_ID=2792 /ORGANISM="Porphyridium aerugineum, Strain SAG 1380-2" /LENGTH=250 /DNA_ID=CAMNT_0027156735 /DNA_START=295 /DNA_END=1047 /DNA_ORIENTATION=+